MTYRHITLHQLPELLSQRLMNRVQVDKRGKLGCEPSTATKTAPRLIYISDSSPEVADIVHLTRSFVYNL